MLFRPDPCRICNFPFDGAPASPVPRIAHVSAEIGDNGLLIEAALDVGCDGIIVSGMGGVHVPPAMVPPLASAAARVPVVFASRCPNDGVLAATYGYPGGEIDLARRGMIRAGRLSPSKAHEALVLALHRGQAVSDIRRFFVEFGGG